MYYLKKYNTDPPSSLVVSCFVFRKHIVVCQVQLQNTCQFAHYLVIDQIHAQTVL